MAVTDRVRRESRRALGRVFLAPDQIEFLDDGSGGLVVLVFSRRFEGHGVNESDDQDFVIDLLRVQLTASDFGLLAKVVTGPLAEWDSFQREVEEFLQE
jgi:hypothetical protein